MNKAREIGVIGKTDYIRVDLKCADSDDRTALKKLIRNNLRGKIAKVWMSKGKMFREKG